MSEWSTVALKDIAEINPRESIKKGDIAVKVAMDKLQPFCRDIPEIEYEVFSGGTKFRNGDTIMARITPCLENGKTAMVNVLDDGQVGFGSTEYIVFRAKKGISDPYFLYYLVCSPMVREPAIKSMVGSSGRQRVQTDVVQNLVLSVPSLPEQVKIGEFLKKIDDKIAVNNKINRNLLEQAVSVFKEKIWSQEKNGTIGEYCSIKSGFAFKSSWWTDEGVKVIKIGDISQDNLSLETCSHVDEDKVEKAKGYSVVAGDLVLAMTGATIGKFAMVSEINEPIFVNQRVGKFFLGNEPLKKVPFIYCTLKMDDVYSEVITRGQGSAQPNISGADIMTIPCVIPTQNEIDEFNSFAEPIFTQLAKNQNESKKLALLRDSLLPKLMSGELAVSDLDI